MTVARLLTGVIMFMVGIVLCYYLLPKTDEPVQKKINIKEFRSAIGSIFIMLGLLRILTFCFGIDGSNYTAEKEDDMTILSGIALLVCILSLEMNITYYLRKLKKYRHLKKETAKSEIKKTCL